MPPTNGQVPTWNDALDPPFEWDNAPAGTPASTVTNETSWGIAPAVGTSTAYARADHTHGTPAEPGAASPSGTVASETAFGQSTSAGTAATYSRGDHTHGTPANPVTGHESSYAHGNLPTSGQKAALAGTSGTPGDANRYVTNDDSRNTNARTPTAHNHGASDVSSGTLDGDRLPAINASKKGGVPATGTASGKFLKDDGTWASPSAGASAARIFTPMATSASSDLSTYEDAGLVKACYLGRACEAWTTCKIVVSVRTAGSSISWAEFAVFTGSPVPNGAAALTRVEYTDVSGIVDATGVKVVEVDVTGIAAGDDLWLVYGADADTMPRFQAGWSAEAFGLWTGLHTMRSSSRPSTISGGSSFQVDDASYAIFAAAFFS